MTIKPSAIPATWDPEALYLKAERYAQHMGDYSSEDWEYALWSSLALELLARAALANVSPALLAETDKGWSSLYYSLGFSPTEERFTPKSIATNEVFKRLAAIPVGFAKEHENFGILHTGRRNAELHSGELPFDGLKGSAWEPRFYQTCEILLKSMGKTLKDFFGKEIAKIAKQIMEAAADESAKAVKGEVEAHKKVWNAKEEAERIKLTAQAEVWASRHSGHRVICPSCGSPALVVGEPVSSPTQKLDNGNIKETQEHLPSRFECMACGLKISTLSRLTAMGLGDRYKKTQIYDAAEYYAMDDELARYEDDNNEP